MPISTQARANDLVSAPSTKVVWAVR